MLERDRESDGFPSRLDLGRIGRSGLETAAGGDVKTPDLPAAANDIASQPPVVNQDAAESKQTTTSEGSEATSQTTNEQKHTLAKGDNFWNLAKKAYGDGALWKKISDANPGLRPRALPVGKEITVPAK